MKLASSNSTENYYMKLAYLKRGSFQKGRENQTTTLFSRLEHLEVVVIKSFMRKVFESTNNNRTLNTVAA